MEDFDWSEYNEYISDEIIDSWAYKDFKEKFFSLRFIGYDYNPFIYDGSKVYTFMNDEGNILKVFNTLGVTIDQIEEHREKYKVVLRRQGYYEFQNTEFSSTDSKDIVIAFEEEWLRYEDVINKRIDMGERKRREQEIQRQINRNTNGSHYDLSGDDLSLDPRMW